MSQSFIVGGLSGWYHRPNLTCARSIWQVQVLSMYNTCHGCCCAPAICTICCNIIIIVIIISTPGLTGYHKYDGKHTTKDLCNQLLLCAMNCYLGWFKYCYSKPHKSHFNDSFSYHHHNLHLCTSNWKRLKRHICLDNIFKKMKQSKFENYSYELFNQIEVILMAMLCAHLTMKIHMFSKCSSLANCIRIKSCQ